MARLSIKKYQDMKINSAKNADPYELVQMVFKAILGKLTAATVCIEQNKIADKGQLISESITLITSLAESLDMEKGGDISQNLSALYEFCTSYLVQANSENDIAKVNEVHTIITNIKEAWDSIPKQARDEHLEQRAAVG
ncbi:flagellar export chaperone FliS [Psychrosphaera sp. B3R10]|uniref:Flagellar secretion chaperone FliS n=1 Tax=Psychrosphaera algicola TaxID=3023714 RepID=A0ABT5FCG4_9GAMM|nr:MULTISPECIES: flagellar export chaperone FliS [unclassified Psychrosphaera]MBU2884042.1 flagellar export chaperone FliS [Psychrosphaera sp. I2R16]MBU2988172.1 flagellar export chaperone FliS [Psychrosphaera sp. B3R10]MDC2888275.1 flagellar export chaperone FliS [Psychrosphaera sp. G1-22]MDO6718381.1 flagellar export chaperone FliS [Psychrosphaera sp. 1_MG-2023]